MADSGYNLARIEGRAKSSAAKFFDENPLGVGFIALLVGAAIGMVLPRTDTENHLLGGAREKFLEKARGTADEFKQTARKTANEVKGQIKAQFLA